MSSFNIGEAKRQFYSLVDLAIAGEEIVISKRGKPIAKLVPIESSEAESKEEAHE